MQYVLPTLTKLANKIQHDAIRDAKPITNPRKSHNLAPLASIHLSAYASPLTCTKFVHIKTSNRESIQTKNK